MPQISEAPPRILYLVTASRSALLLRGQLSYLKKHGLTVGLACSPGEQLEKTTREEGIESFAIPMKREIAPFSDLRSLFKLCLLIGRWKPDVVIAATPKAGLLGLLAATLFRIPRRIYHLWGLPWESRNGWKKSLLAATEKIASACAHEIWPVSHSLAESFLSAGLSTRKKIRVLAKGSSNGVDPRNFPRAQTQQCTELRARLGIPAEAPVIGFVGRLTPDKGILELSSVFERLSAEMENVHLLIVGDLDVPTAGLRSVLAQLGQNPRVSITGLVTDPSPFYSVMDVLLFPSHREGFPNVILEASLFEIPSVGFDVTGVKDAIVEGSTGSLCSFGNVDCLSQKVRTYLSNPSLRRAHGKSARERTLRDYRAEIIWECLLEEFQPRATSTPRRKAAH